MILRELVNSVEALNILTDTKLPAKTSFKLGVFLKDINEDIEMYNKTKNSKLEVFGEPVEGEPGKYTFSKENGEKFVNEIKELEEIEITKEIPEIKIEDLGNVEIEPKHLVTLSWLIK